MNIPLASLVRPSARHPTVAGFRVPFVGLPCIREAHFRHRGAPVLTCSLHFVRMWICYVRCLRFRLPPSKHSPPSPVGHGRGLASRSGCAGPGEGIDSAGLRLHRFRRVVPPRPSRFRLRPAFIHARRTAAPNVFTHLPASTGPCIRPSLRSDVDLL